jgi:glycosyltransferase involved in cell wall biosynthesis
MPISVARAMWNGEQFIGEQLTSIARQSRFPDELVLCDDASTDGPWRLRDDLRARRPSRSCACETIGLSVTT